MYSSMYLKANLRLTINLFKCQNIHNILVVNILKFYLTRGCLRYRKVGWGRCITPE